jgi:Flp pilus assembly protein TadG
MFRRIIAKCKEWGVGRRGSVAIEFAQIGIPFIFMTVAIIELSLFFAAANMLESGVNESARMIKIGQLQQQTERPQEEVYREALCSNLAILIKCSDVDIEVVEITDGEFTSADDFAPVYDEDGRLVPREFNASGSEGVVLIRAATRYRLLTPLFSRIFSREPDQTIPLISTVVMKIEPYDFNPDQENT